MRWGSRKNREADLDRELRCDLELEALEQQGKGLSPEDARYAAKRALGNPGLIKEEIRDAWGWGWFDRLRQDVVYALRTFGRAPGFTSVVILTLALGIGATTAMFSVVHAVLLNPLPFPNQNRLVVIFEKFADRPDDPPFFASYHDFENWKDGNPKSFERLAVATWSAGGDQIMIDAGRARNVFAMPVGIDFFPMLGIAPELGRAFEPEDLSAGCTVILKHSFWVETFGGQKNAIGRHVDINRDTCTIVGVMPPQFKFYPDAANMWMLITPDSAIARNPNANVGVFGLLKPGVSMDRAQSEVAGIYKSSPRPVFGIRVMPEIFPLAEQFARLTGPTLRLSVIILFGAVTFVLLIGCVNIANLFLSRSVTRQKELALRAALGSSRARIVHQVLTEALILAVGGSGIGILLAMAAVHYFTTAHPIDMPPGNPVAVNVPVLAFTATLAVLTAVLFGMLPALKASRVDLMDCLRVSAQAESVTRSGRTARRTLVIVEVALSLALLVGAELLVQSAQRLGSIPLGFRTDHVITMPIKLPKWIYSTNELRARFFRAAFDRTAAVSGVVSPAFTSLLPPDGFGGSGVAVEGKPEPRPDAEVPYVPEVSVSTEYFKVLGIPLKAGRGFDDRDGYKSLGVAIVNETFGRNYFPNENPIGRRIKVLAGREGERPERPWLTIVGVVGDEKHQDFFHPMSWQEPAMVFRPLDQEPPSHAFLVFRTPANGTTSATNIQKQIGAIDKNVPLGDIQTMDERLTEALAYPQLRAKVLAAFAGFALLLAAIGLYAVLSEFVAQRTREFGVRMALGAKKSDLLTLVLREGAVLVLVGLAAGLIIALSVGRLLRSLLYGLTATDPLTLTTGSLLLVSITLLAICIPAISASRVDPKIALRYE